MNIKNKLQTFLSVLLLIIKTLCQTQKHQNIHNPTHYKQKIAQLIKHLDMDFTQDWIYKDLFNHPKALGVTPKLLQRSISNLGDETRMKQILIQALHGKKIELSIIGGSISRGAPWAETGKGYRIYFNAVQHWWNRIFAPITSSRMFSKSISIGGVGTDYFSFCLNTHLAADTQSKIIFWELAANDRGRYDDKPFPPGQPLEQFTRNVLQRKAKPALFFLNFFRGHDYLGGKCKNFEDEGGLTVAKHYRICSISWRNFVCDSMKQKVPFFSMANLFAADQLHPSILGHAQMAFLVIYHLKNSFLRMLTNHAIHEHSLASFEKATREQGDINIASIIYHETSTNNPKCFTFFKYNEYEPNNTLALKFIRHDDFHYNIFKQFKVRTDKLGGMQTYISEQLLQAEFFLNRPYAKLIVTTHSQTGNSQMWLDKDTPVIVETDKLNMGTIVDLVTTNIMPGKHILNVLSMKKGTAVCAIAVI